MTASDAISFRSEPEPLTAAFDGAATAPVEYDNPQNEKWSPRMRLLVLPARRESELDRWLWPAVAMGVAALYLYALLSFWAPAHPGTDQNGYFVGARQFAHTLSSGLKPESDYGFVGHMWVMADSGVNYPKYPLGLPILYAACLWIFGEARGVEVAHLVSPVSAVLATLGVFAITRRLAGGFMGVMAMMLLACGQVMLTLSVNPNSHAACTCAVVWGMFFLLRWLESGAIWRGIAAGGLFGAAYMIRYTEGLLLLPIGVALLYSAQWRFPGRKRLAITLVATFVFAFIGFIVAKTCSDWRFGSQTLTSTFGWLQPFTENNGRMVYVLVAAISLNALVTLFITPQALVRWMAVEIAWLVPVVYLTIFNMVAMHSFTSYAGTNESTGFEWSFFQANWEKMVRVIHDQGLFFIAPLGVLGLICMYRRLPLVATILTLWFVPSVLLYTAYYWAPDNMGVAYSRFILTQLPALVISAAWLMGELTRSFAGRAVEPYNIIRHLTAASAVAVGIAAIVVGMRYFDHGGDSEWWALVPTGAVVAVGGAVSLLALLDPARSVFYARQMRGSVPRLGVAVLVFISCSLGAYRTVLGSEWGQRIMVRANIEIQSRQNMNLAGLGDEVRRAVDRSAKEKTAGARDDSNVVLFADGDRLNHLQWIGGWQLFSVDAFNYERSGRFIGRMSGNDTDPDPIDPTRVKFLQGVYKDNDQRSLQADQNTLIAKWLAAGKRVFYVLSDNSSKQFGRQIDRRQFDVKDVGTYSDVPSPRLPEDFLLPSERPKQPVNRFGRGNAFGGPNFLDNEKMLFRIGQIVRKPSTPATIPPTTVPTTAPTTGPATLPTTQP